MEPTKADIENEDGETILRGVDVELTDSPGLKPRSRQWHGVFYLTGSDQSKLEAGDRGTMRLVDGQSSGFIVTANRGSTSSGMRIEIILTDKLE